MGEWTTPAGTIQVVEVGLCIDGEYLPDKEGPTHDADA